MKIIKHIERGKEYLYKERGYTLMEAKKVTLIASHPHDGAYLIVEGYNEEEGENYFFGCEREELKEIEDGNS